ncbi:MAG: CsiV family protein [Pseudomonadales bacterium]
MKHKVRNFIAPTLAIFVACMLGAGTSAAEHDDVYLIEMVVFADDRATGRDHASDAPGSEHWRNPDALAYPANLVFLRGEQSDIDAAPDAQLAEDDMHSDRGMPLLQLLQVADSEISDVANHLRKRSRFRVLFEGSWLQALTDRDRAPAVVLQGGRRYEPWQELMGSVTFSRERYLHINTELWFSEFVEQALRDADEPWYVAQAKEVQLPLPAGSRRSVVATEGGSASFAGLYPHSDYHVRRTYTLREFRRLKRDQLNYLDHPVFGAIVKVSRRETPADEPGEDDEAATLDEITSQEAETAASAAAAE